MNTVLKAAEVIKAGAEARDFILKLKVPDVWLPARNELKRYIAYAWRALVLGEMPTAFGKMHLEALRKMQNLYKGEVLLRNLPDLTPLGMEWEYRGGLFGIVARKGGEE